MERFRIEVGHEHGVQPRNIVGAIANEAGLDAQHIGRVDIEAQFSVVELPVGMPSEVLHDLKKVWVCGRTLNISPMDRGDGKKKGGSKRAPKKPTPSKPTARKKGDRKKAPKKQGSGKTSGNKNKNPKA